MTKDKTHEDDALWQEVTKTVTPLENRPAAKELPKRKRFYKTPDDSAVPAEWLDGASAAPHPSIDKNTTRRLATGKASIDRTIDLHDHTQDVAYEQLKRALIRGVKNHHRCLLVITGKGGRRQNETLSGSAGERTRNEFGLGTGTLKRMVPVWLENEEFSAMVTSYAPAAKHHGGDGALYVMLRRQR